MIGKMVQNRYIRIHTRFLPLFLLSLLIPLNSQARPQFPALTGRVVDAAHVLSTTIQQEITSLSEKLEQETTDQLVVVYSIEDYS